MTAKLAILSMSLFTASALMPKVSAEAPAKDMRVIRLAELTIDPVQLETYTAELKREIEDSIRIEPGVLTLYAVAIKGHPEQLRILEIYRDQAAYEAHLDTPHFKRYKSKTQGMVKSLKLMETEPILLGGKPR